MTNDEAFTSRRTVMTGGLFAAGSFLLAGCVPAPGAAGHLVDGSTAGKAKKEIEALERSTGVTIGVAAGSGLEPLITHRETDLFPLCSLFKTLAVAELLRRKAYDEDFWSRNVAFSSKDLVENSPVTSKNTTGSMTLASLADAALRFSDNTAGNLLLRQLGGPEGFTAAIRRLGASKTRLDRWEPELNEATPGDDRDTSTPADIYRLYGDALLGRSLGRLGTARLNGWMLRNTTSSERIRAAVPAAAEVADKTGAGAYGVVNDAGVIWEGERTMTVAIMTRTDNPKAKNDNTVVRRAAEILWKALQ